MSIPLKCLELVPYIEDFADDNDRAGLTLRLYDQLLQLQQDHTNLGFVLDTLLAISVTQNLKYFQSKETLLSKLSKFP